MTLKTGNVGNIVLGIGDPSKFNLLGGSFGEAGDVISGPNGARRFLAAVTRDRLLRGGIGAPGRTSSTGPVRGFDPDGGGIEYRER